MSAARRDPTLRATCLIQMLTSEEPKCRTLQDQSTVVRSGLRVRSAGSKTASRKGYVYEIFGVETPWQFPAIPNQTNPDLPPQGPTSLGLGFGLGLPKVRIMQVP